MVNLNIYIYIEAEKRRETARGLDDEVKRQKNIGRQKAKVQITGHLEGEWESEDGKDREIETDSLAGSNCTS